MLCIDMSQMPARRFQPPWSVEEQPVCFMMRNHSGQALAVLKRAKRRMLSGLRAGRVKKCSSALT